MMKAGINEKLKITGIYLIVILGLLRFLVYPLYNAAERQKKGLEVQRENHGLKIRILEQQQKNMGSTSAVVNRDDLTPYLYEKSQSLMQIQLDTVQRLSAVAKENGGNLVRFEMLETISGKNIGDAPITIWFSGQPQALMKIMQNVETTRKLLIIRSMEINKGPKDYMLSLTLSAYRLER